MMRLRALVRDESGIALIAVMALMGLLVVVAVTLTALTSNEVTRSNTSARANSALQAAEAGVDTYVADLTEDTGFFLDYIAAGEARRTYNGAQYPTTAGANANANVSLSPSWGRTATWTYPSNVTTDPGWRTLSGTAYEYLLEVFPNSSLPNDIRVVGIGRPTPTGASPASDTADYRAVEIYVNALSISDFQMLSAKNITYGSSATTTGWVYATLGDNGNPTSICHGGTATDDLFTENTMSSYSGSGCSTKLVSPAREYASNSSPSIRTVINEPITFADLRESQQIAPVSGGEGSIELDAQSNGIDLDNLPTTYNFPVPDAYWLKFRTGTTNNLEIDYCTEYYTTGSGGSKTYSPVAEKQPTCTQVGGAGHYFTLNTGTEEIYTTADVIVSGTVESQVTIYTAGGAKAAGDGSIAAGNVDIGGNISYGTPGSDVLGLVANENVIIACYAGSTLSWTAATISLNGEWASDSDIDSGCSAYSSGSKPSMTFTGSTATDQGGAMGEYTNGTRTYNYDPTLRYLPPPDYPQIPSAFKIMYERQIAVP